MNNKQLKQLLRQNPEHSMGKQELFWKLYTERLKHQSKAKQVFEKIKKPMYEYESK